MPASVQAVRVGALQCRAKSQEKHHSSSLAQVFDKKEKARSLVSSGEADKNGKLHLSSSRKLLAEQKQGKEP